MADPTPLVERVAAATRAAASGEQPEPIAVELRDGSIAELRPIRPEDADRLREGLKLLSPRSRYMRFHTGITDLGERELRYLTDVDHDHHVAWVALDPDHPDVPGMGVARYVRLDPPNIAEAAITVADDYQGRGLGTILLAVLGGVAASQGVDMFRNYVLEANDTMLQLFDELGATREREARDVWRVDLPVPGDPNTLPDSPAGRAIRALAHPGTQRRGILSFSFPRLWLDRLRRHDEPTRDESTVD